ncbi:hypothetical protein LTS72_01100 [Mycobacterium ostraviense]|uniref:Uncharacterized protein n=1 Tax=Mycobacterium ostraviense TaxID=2738409 RepID=A0A163XQ35_9MYCO|nr:hypothetical protein [Mycobacterium ostraviense]KZS59620.1 hypothetical protein A4G28_09850 [Mycobacterium ostraviense]UGT92080.1 hypothetical protein LTS72_01100 [Mycobacterium ostraviense]
MSLSLFGCLTIFSFVAELVFAVCAFVFVRRLLAREPTPMSENVGSVRMVLSKLRKGEPMSEDELDFATQVIADRRSLLAYSIPAAIFTIGCLYVFGSLEQLHGRTPSLRTFIGVLPMLGAINLTAQLHRIAILKRRLPSARKTAAPVAQSGQREAESNF